MFWLPAWRRILSSVVVVATVALVSPGVSAAAPAQVQQSQPPTPQVAAADAGGWHAVDARRILDTRSGLGATGPVPGNGTLTVKVAGTGGLPSGGLAAVAVTITVPAAAQSGTISAYARGSARPAAPSVTFTAGRGVSTLALVPVDAGGYLTLANNSTGPVQLVVDSAGYTVAGGPAVPGTWVPLTPSRVLDTAAGIGASGPVAARRSITARLAGQAGIPATGVAAVTMVVTVTQPARDGFLTVRPTSQVPAGTNPVGSNINFTARQNSGNLVVVPMTGAGTVQLFNNAYGAIGLTVDVTGYVTAGTPVVGSLVPVTMTRLLDTRSGLGMPAPARPAPLPPHSVNIVQTRGQAGLPASGVSAVLLSVTVAQPTRTGILRVHRDIADGSTTSNLNFSTGRGSTNLVLVPVTSSGVIHLTNPTDGTVQVIVDVVGYLQGDATEPAMTWSAAAPSSAALGSPDLLDCTSDTFCLAVDDATASVYRGSGWSAAPGGPGGLVAALSCASETFCVAVNYAGAAAVYDGAVWKPPVTVAPGRVLAGVSCVSATFCLAISDAGTAYRWTGTGWTGAAAVTEVPDDYSPSPQTISCASTTFCVAAGTNGGGWSFDGVTWSEESIGLQDGVRASCPVAGFCSILDSANDGWTLSGGGWNVAAMSWSETMTGLDCADATFCASVGGNQITVWDGIEWTNPALPESLPGTASVISCPTHQFCMTLGYPGHQIIGTR